MSEIAGLTAKEFSTKSFELMDKILSHYAGEKFTEDLKHAKAQFFDNAGVLDENDQNYELRMSQFFDWYFFTRDLLGYGKTPLIVADLARELRYNEIEKEMIEALKNHRHGIFEFRKMSGDEIYLKDLLKNEKLVVKESPWKFGFNSDELFEARLVPYKDSWIFTKGCCFHPKDARKYILTEIKKHRKEPDLNRDIMILKLLRMRYKSDRYKHVPVSRIYSEELGI